MISRWKIVSMLLVGYTLFAKVSRVQYGGKTSCSTFECRAMSFMAKHEIKKERKEKLLSLQAYKILFTIPFFRRENQRNSVTNKNMYFFALLVVCVSCLYSSTAPAFIFLYDISFELFYTNIWRVLVSNIIIIVRRVCRYLQIFMLVCSTIYSSSRGNKKPVIRTKICEF